MQHFYLTVDIGGTSFRVALLDTQGKIHILKSVSAEEIRHPRNLIKRLISECQALRQETQEGEIQGLALGIPGLVDAKEGVVYQSPHFPLWKEVPLKAELTPHFPFPIFMENDANQAALGEAWQGAGRDRSDFIMLTLGTGIGGGIISNGKIFHGPYGFAGEIGHMVIDRNGFVGALESQGTLESFCSQSGLKLRIQAMQNSGISIPAEILQLNAASPKLPEELQQLALSGNETAKKIWKDFGQALGCGLASLGHILGIFRFIIGGGLAGAWELFIDACHEETSHRLYTTTAKQVEIVRTKLGDQAGLIGGVHLIQQKNLIV